MNKWESERVRSIQPSATIAISDRIKHLRSTGQDLLDLVSGAAEFDTPPEIKESARLALEQDHRYMSYSPAAGLLQLRESIAAKLAEENDIAATPEEIIVTVGVKQGLALATQACLQPGDEVLLFTPAWVTYDALIRLAGAKPVCIPLGDHRMPGDAHAALQQSITSRTRAILLNTPHNPSGHVYRRDELEMVARLAHRHDLLVLVDETLEYLVYADVAPVSIGALPNMAQRTLTFNGFSKAFCMAGWRVGYVTGPKPLIENMLKLHQHSVTCANVVAQMGAAAALASREQSRRAIFEQLLTRRDRMVKAFNHIPGIHCPAPEAGLFCFPNISGTGMDDQSFADFCLEHAGVALLPGSAFGEGGEGHVRVAFGRRSIEKMTAGFERLSNALHEYDKVGHMQVSTLHHK